MKTEELEGGLLDAIQASMCPHCQERDSVAYMVEVPGVGSVEIKFCAECDPGREALAEGLDPFIECDVTSKADDDEEAP